MGRKKRPQSAHEICTFDTTLGFPLRVMYRALVAGIMITSIRQLMSMEANVRQMSVFIHLSHQRAATIFQWSLVQFVNTVARCDHDVLLARRLKDKRDEHLPLRL